MSFSKQYGTSAKTTTTIMPVTETSEPQQSAWLQRFRGRTHLHSQIRPTSFAEKQLLLLTFTTGMQDALTFPDYNCFTSNQTGNSVLLAVSLNAAFAGHSKANVAGETSLPFTTANIAVSLVCFLLGASITGQIGHHILHPLSRPWILITNFMQTAMVFAAAGIQYFYGVEVSGSVTLIVLALLAFASGSQVVVSRSLYMTEISTAMATAAWVDLLVDPALLKSHNRPRDRRALFLVTLFFGSFIGAITYARIGSTWALFISGIGKLIATISFCFNPDQLQAPPKVVEGKTHQAMLESVV